MTLFDFIVIHTIIVWCFQNQSCLIYSQSSICSVMFFSSLTENILHPSYSWMRLIPSAPPGLREVLVVIVKYRGLCSSFLTSSTASNPNKISKWVCQSTIQFIIKFSLSLSQKVHPMSKIIVPAKFEKNLDEFWVMDIIWVHQSCLWFYLLFAGYHGYQPYRYPRFSLTKTW